MPHLRRSIPSMSALATFEAAARLTSFTNAATELGVTQAAVSRQIKLLEEALQVKLLERRGRTIELTEQAVLLAHYVKAGLDEFAEGVRLVAKSVRRDRINLKASPYFATHYLLARLSDFRDLIGEADLRLTTMIDMPDFGSDEIDMTIQWGYGDWSGYQTTLLVADPKIICCTPAIATQISSASDLSRFIL